MKTFHKSMDRLRERLCAAYASRTAEAPPAGSRWRQEVMRSVRQIGPIGEHAFGRVRSGHLAWRLAPAALALMVILAVMILQVDHTIENQMASLAMSDPVQTYITYPLF
jgi:anti-sigma-K factor RskA